MKTILKKKQKMPKIKKITCTAFTAKGTRCKGKCPKGFTRCTAHLKGGSSLTYFGNTGESKRKTKKHLKLIATDDESSSSSSESSSSSSSESESSSSSSSDSDDDVVISKGKVKTMKKPKKPVPSQTLRGNQCMCFDGAVRCQRNVAEGEMYYCYKHKQDPCMDIIKGSDVSAKEFKRRNEQHPVKYEKTINKTTGVADEFDTDKCCGKSHKGKCSYKICGDDGKQSQPMIKKAIADAKRDGKKKIAKELAEKCTNCGSEVVTIVKEIKLDDGTTTQRTTRRLDRDNKKGKLEQSEMKVENDDGKGKVTLVGKPFVKKEKK